MNSPLISLPNEVFQQIVELLSINDASDLIHTCNELFDKGKDVLHKRLFSVLLVNLSSVSLDQADLNLTEEPYHRFRREVCIRLDQYGLNGPYGLRHEILAEHLASMLTRALQVSTYCDTITIYDSPEIFHDTDCTRMRTVANAIEMVDAKKPFKIRAQNLRIQNGLILWLFGHKASDNLQSIRLVFDKRPKLWELDEFLQLLDDAPNLEELSLIVNHGSISSEVVQQITESISSKKLRSLTITKLSISGITLQNIIQPFKASIKKLTLKHTDFDDFHSFIEFILYIKSDLLLDYVYFKEISTIGGVFLDREKFRGKDIEQNLDLLSRNILQMRSRS